MYSVCFKKDLAKRLHPSIFDILRFAVPASCQSGRFYHQKNRALLAQVHTSKKKITNHNYLQSKTQTIGVGSYLKFGACNLLFLSEP